MQVASSRPAFPIAARIANLSHAKKMCLLLLTVVVIAAAFFFPGVVDASSAAAGLPWESPLDKFVNSMKGPVAYGVSILGLVVFGGTLIFGGELNEFTRRIFIAILVISVLAFATSVLSSIFGMAAVL